MFIFTLEKIAHNQNESNHVKTISKEVTTFKKKKEIDSPLIT